VGKVTAIRFTAPDAFRLDVFVFAPYDRLMRPAATFWISSPVQVSLTDKGASATLEHAGALLNGAVELDFLNRTSTEAQSPAGAEFPLYQSRKEAETGPPGPEATYAFRFVGPAGELSEGAAVRLLGFQVGVVKSVRLDVDPATGVASTSVIAALYPQSLHIKLPAGSTNPASTDASAWQRLTDGVVSRLLARGHRARLVQTPPVIGGRVISLDAVRGAGPARLGEGQPRLIPSDDASGGLDEMTGQVNDLLAKLNRFPLEAIGQDVRHITAKLDGIVSSPQLTDSLQHLNSTLAQADSMMHDVQPQVGPLVAKLNRAADEVTGTAAAAHDLLGGQSGGGAAADGSLPAAIQELGDAARSIRALADYLGRHPESLIRGRGADKTDQTGKDGR
jgi:paraquat-inducible protein B